MPLLWRISNYADLQGTGGLRYGARWHTAGRPVIYAAEHPAGALAEMLIQIAREDLPDNFQLLTIELAPEAAVETIPTLPPGWSEDIAATRAIGDQWLLESRSLALRVPSAILPGVWNILLNPSRANASQMRVVRAERVAMDSRLR